MNPDLHLFARQRVLDEHDLAFGIASHALRFEVERFSLQPFIRVSHRAIIPVAAGEKDRKAAAVHSARQERASP